MISQLLKILFCLNIEFYSKDIVCGRMYVFFLLWPRKYRIAKPFELLSKLRLRFLPKSTDPVQSETID